MWKRSKQAISAGDNSVNVIAGRDVNILNPPTELIDQIIGEEVEKLRQSRFFSEFNQANASFRLGRHLSEGDLSGGSDKMRRWGLAWCARVLSSSDDLKRAETFLEYGKTLGDAPETMIAEAFLISQKGDKASALQTVAGIGSGASRSAALLIVAHHNGAADALAWITTAGYAIDDFDSDGKFFLLTYQLQQGYWDDAAQTVSVLSQADFAETPVLHHFTAIATLIPTVPVEFRTAVLSQVPFDASSFPLASDAASMELRRTAHQRFLNAVEAAKQLDCPRAARTDDEYALWLELRDPLQADRGMSRLEARLRDSSTALSCVHLALQFGIKLDLDAVERDIERSIAINGGMTIDAATARYALAFAQPTHEEAANYIARHHNQLATHIDATLIRHRQIEMLSKAGLVDRANEVLDLLLEEGISLEQENRLRRIITEAREKDPVESRKAQYRATNSLSDLMNLVVELEAYQHWDDLCEFGRLLFDQTRSLGDAERLVKALYYTHRSESLVRFLNENADLLSQSTDLAMAYAWNLYYEGEFLDSLAALAQLSDEMDSPNYRALQVNLAIATGDWASLSAYVATEYQNRDSRSASDLMSAAQLAHLFGSPYAKDLVIEAAKKADADATVLASAYFIAMSAGWEDDPLVFWWLEKAAELSGDDGPIQSVSLKDIFDRKPEWDRRESETWRLLAQGQIPIFLAAQSLNRTLIDIMIFPALANLNETDPRRKRAIPAYSGKRVPLKFEAGGKTIALDATAVLTLGFLGILDVTLDAFEAVYIPHSTLGWLFEERQRASFHQPSRIVDARKVRDLLATGMLEKLTPTTAASSDLSAQVGDELAALIAEAEKAQDGNETQHIVIRPAPVHRLSSLIEEEADLSAHADVLSSCLAVVEKLRQKGQITAAEEQRARAYLQLHEKAWPQQPNIADGATLYLENLAVSHLLHLGLLGKIKASGLRAVTSSRVVSEADSLISYEHISEEVKDLIERVRASLHTRIRSGQVRASRMQNNDQFEEKSIPEHPSLGIFALVPICDVMIIDDRFLNQHANIDNTGVQVPVLSTLDLLDALVVIGVITDDNRLECRTRLRQAGYFFVPVAVDELERCLRESTVVDGRVVETAELKAIRESVLRVRMSDWLQLPEEAPWLDGTLQTFVGVLRNLWVDGADISDVAARSDWLIQQSDIRGWAHRLAPESADYVIQTGRAAHILGLLAPLNGVQKDVMSAYWDWVEERILVPLQEQFPTVYNSLVGWYRNRIEEMAETQLSEDDNS